MIPHAFRPDPHGRDVCDQKTDEDGRVEFCGQRRSEHMDETHALKIQLATALRERDEARAELARHETCIADNDKAFDKSLGECLDRAEKAESERDALRTALQDIVTLCMDVPATEDWRAKVGDKARKALYGEAAWETK